MRKIFLMALAALCLVSCSKDKSDAPPEKKVRLVKNTTQTASYAYTYDANGRMRTQEYTSKSQGFVYTFTFTKYDNNGNLLEGTIDYKEPATADQKLVIEYKDGKLFNKTYSELTTGNKLNSSETTYEGDFIIVRSYNKSDVLTGITKYKFGSTGRIIANEIYTAANVLSYYYTVDSFDDKKSPTSLYPTGYLGYTRPGNDANAVTYTYYFKNPEKTDPYSVSAYEYNSFGYPTKRTITSVLTSGSWAETWEYEEY